ncbi:MAG: hypothetical protein ACM37V_16580 [Gemmatimonadota bacterium]
MLRDAPVTGTVELHGLPVQDAERVVRGIVETWHRRGGGVLHFITGTGTRSLVRLTLEDRIAALLRRDLSAYVAEWVVDEADGGFKVRVR